MKRFPKILMALLVLALFVGMFSTVTFANQLKGVNLTVSQLQVGYYTNLSGDLTLHCANSDIDKETKNLVDNKSKPFYWSKPYRFDELKEINGEPNPNASKVPAILIDVANGGDGVAICGYSMQLREYLDCVPYSFEIQATLTAGSNDWTKLFADSKTAEKWAGDMYSCTFAEVTVYKVRILFYEIGEANPAKDTAYGTLDSYSTRFSLSEINLLANLNTTTPTEAPTQAPTAATRPMLPMTQPATAEPTQVPTAAPTTMATAAPTTKPTEAPTTKPTEAPTTAPTTKPTEAPTAAPTEAPTTKPTEAPATAPTVAPTTKQTEAPTEAPTVAPTVKPTEAPTVSATVKPTQSPTTAPTQAPTQAATAAPTQVATEVPTQAPTEATTVETTPVATEPEALTTEPTAEPTTPSEDATEPDGLITTVPATGPATEPEDGASVSDVGGADKPDNTPVVLIVVAIVVFCALMGVLVFFIIKNIRIKQN